MTADWKTTTIETYQRLLGAWNQHDATAFAALFAENGNCVGFDGSQMNGPAEIAAELGRIFRDHPTARYVAKVREVRPLGERAVLLRAVVGMVPPGKNEINSERNAIQGLVVIIGPTEAKIELFQNTPAAFHGRPEMAEEMTRELREVFRTSAAVAAD